ncbi:peptidogalycan biosysnthesis protein [Winogradskyella aurantia]|uniref:GNAT family N-acetyltransferase n=1 Tax=Winogradskyella aurantia TaxID=1915063 RepID=A0A265UZH6_9FLAO|nr:peptidogalycan biosysnthesis protein [Winogradskyella aurantia]OZV70701.1 hypothetical protein CA834_00890 [Winogradskyella aurantia]
MSLNSEIFSSITTIPKSYWSQLGCEDNIYYTPEFLKAFEFANKGIDFNYIFILRDQIPVAFANTQRISIGIETITKNTRMPSLTRQLVNTIFRHRNLHVLFCGNIFLSGEYGIFLKENQDKTTAFNAIARALGLLSKNTRKLHTLFIKDFENDSLHITNLLHLYDYASMQVEPNMIIYLKPEWQTFNDYKSDLKSKYRIKANKADAKSKPLEVQLFSKNDIITHKNELQDLYQNTIDNADFNAQILNLETYIHLKETFKEAFLVQGYFLKNKLVGFLSAMKNGTHLDAHFIGIDYSKNNTYAIYPRILNDYVRLGISTNSSQINLGRTASEIKSTLGAQPKPLTCYCKHKRYLPNKILKSFIKNVRIKTYKQHQPYK